MAQAFLTEDLNFVLDHVIRVLVVRKQNHLDPAFQRELQEFVNPNRERKILQIVGDGAPFSKFGETKADLILRQFLGDNAESAILWGYTGSAGPGRDINQILNDWIDENPPQRSPRCFANIVDKGTIRAIRDWGCRYPEQPAPQRNFIAMIGDAEFGDDIALSDSMTDHLIVFEGGLQSFEQAVNCLKRNCKITIIDGLRTEERRSHFSAAHFIRRIISNDADEYIGLMTEKQRASIKPGFERLQLISSNLAECVTIID